MEPAEFFIHCSSAVIERRYEDVPGKALCAAVSALAASAVRVDRDRRSFESDRHRLVSSCVDNILVDTALNGDLIISCSLSSELNSNRSCTGLLSRKKLKSCAFLSLNSSSLSRKCGSGNIGNSNADLLSKICFAYNIACCGCSKDRSSISYPGKCRIRCVRRLNFRIDSIPNLERFVRTFQGSETPVITGFWRG